MLAKYRKNQDKKENEELKQKLAVYKEKERLDFDKTHLRVTGKGGTPVHASRDFEVATYHNHIGMKLPLTIKEEAPHFKLKDLVQNGFEVHLGTQVSYKADHIWMAERAPVIGKHLFTQFAEEFPPKSNGEFIINFRQFLDLPKEYPRGPPGCPTFRWAGVKVVLDPPPTKRFKAGPNTYLEPLFEMKSFGYEENDDAVISFNSVEYCPYNDDFWIKTEAEWARKQKEISEGTSY
jgi:hypothetical protein